MARTLMWASFEPHNWQNELNEITNSVEHRHARIEIEVVHGGGDDGGGGDDDDDDENLSRRLIRMGQQPQKQKTVHENAIRYHDTMKDRDNMHSLFSGSASSGKEAQTAHPFDLFRWEDVQTGQERRQTILNSMRCG